MDMYDARFEVLTMVLLMIQASWNAVLCHEKIVCQVSNDHSKQSRMSLLCHL
jgi:hypothetical protein